MWLPARVEDRVSIVGMCTPVLALRNLEVGPVQTVVPLLCPHQFFPIVLPWFRPTPGSATNCGSSVSESCAKSTVSRYCNVFTSTHRTKICQGWRGPNNLYQKWQYRKTVPTNTPKEQSRTPNEPKMHDNDKTCFVFRTACLCPNSCATSDDRQMRTTDEDTPHAPKKC